MQPKIAKRLLYSSKIPGNLLPDILILFVPQRPSSSLQVQCDAKKKVQCPLEVLLSKEPPLLMTVMEWSKYYYDQSSDVCQKYYKENIMVTLEKALNICYNSVRQSGLEWYTERQKRITGNSCGALYRYGKSRYPDWERRLEFAYNAKDFPLYLTQATTHGLCHQKAAQKKYWERMKDCSVLDLGLVIHPKVPFLGFSPDGVLLDQSGIPQNLIEIKCPLDGRSFSSEDLLRLYPYVNEKGIFKTHYKYYGQVQLGMFILGLPYCDLVVYSSSESDYTKRKIEFNEQFVKKMMRSLVRVYFEEMLPWLAKKKVDLPVAMK